MPADAELSSARDVGPRIPAPEWKDVISAYERDFPDISEELARAAAEGQLGRATLLEEFGGHESFGGSWFEPSEGVMHVYATTDAFAAQIESAAASLGIDVAIEHAEYSYPSLARLADELNRGVLADESLSKVAVAGADGRWNRVTVAISDPSRIAEVKATLSGDSRVRINVIDHPENTDLTVPDSSTH